MTIKTLSAQYAKIPMHDMSNTHENEDEKEQAQAQEHKYRVISLFQLLFVLTYFFILVFEVKT